MVNSSWIGSSGKMGMGVKMGIGALLVCLGAVPTLPWFDSDPALESAALKPAAAVCTLLMRIFLTKHDLENWMQCIRAQPAISSNILHIISICSAEGLLLLRTWALWNCSRRFATLMGVLSLAFAGAAMALVYQLEINTNGVVGNVGPEKNLWPGTCNFTANKTEAIAFGFLVAYEMILLSLISYQWIRHYRSTKSTLAYLLYRDALLYVCTSTLVSTANIVNIASGPQYYNEYIDRNSGLRDSMDVKQKMLQAGRKREQEVYIRFMKDRAIQVLAWLPGGVKTTFPRLRCIASEHKDTLREITIEYEPEGGLSDDVKDDSADEQMGNETADYCLESHVTPELVDGRLSKHPVGPCDVPLTLSSFNLRFTDIINDDEKNLG
ncbi:hypothetical protein CONPUDRAFT_140856 [Coniophora puteana RWD-64-598 SS2]|uniref:Uncharacterized protein n=1 Tax=Coniophora puteana (strain RWD-64-598) TaxID=741705 RepID=A0A5M3N424_CONPW|nr:uncharacterized protein CONPUDRAFT_140856 [Coniophora puteana RWD-64-598 SS2]EIW86179.1 hypothetical protein CONPUDRAFT_140856 [Coniophora puteana RWD-64-598 SS2]